MSSTISYLIRLSQTMSVLALSAVIVTGLLISASPAAGATFYVSTGGNDANPGTVGAPWRTIRKAASTLVAGDTAIVMNGTYIEPEIQFNNSGTASQRITLQAQNKHQAILSSTSSCNPNISIYDNYITIDGLSLVINPSNVYCTPNSAAGTGVRCWQGGVGCTVRNIKTDDPTGPSGKIRSHGIKTNQDNSLLEDNELAAGLETLGGDNIIIRRNIITGGGEWNHAIVTKGGGHNVRVYNNYVNAPSMSGWGLLLGGANASDSPPQECFNCVAYNNVIRVSTGFRTMGFQGCKDCAFFNNIGFGGAFGMNTAPSSTNSNNTWKNNILDCQGSNATESLQNTYTIDYNLFFNCTGVPSQAHPITGNPQFVNPASNWHLQPGSPALNAGTTGIFMDFSGNPIVITSDYAGIIRTVPWDLGIYAANGVVGDITPPITPSNLRIE
jgi:pectate lyase-like protein